MLLCLNLHSSMLLKPQHLYNLVFIKRKSSHKICDIVMKYYFVADHRCGKKLKFNNPWSIQYSVQSFRVLIIIVWKHFLNSIYAKRLRMYSVECEAGLSQWACNSCRYSCRCLFSCDNRAISPPSVSMFSWPFKSKRNIRKNCQTIYTYFV